MTIDPLVSALTDALLPESPTAVRRRQGTVQAVNAGPPPSLNVTIGGIIIPNVRYLGSYAPTVADVVYVDFNGSDPLVIGAAAPVSDISVVTSATRPANPAVGRVIWETDNATLSIWDGTEWRRSASVPAGTTQTGTFGGGGSTTSTTYVDTPGPVDVNFTKRADASTLEVDIFGTAYTGGAGTLAKLGFSISGTDYDCCKYYFNVGGDHRFFAGKAKLAGIPKTATSLRLRWSTSNGVALNSDNNDFYWCQIMEMR